ncbi:Inactive tyrosine-protein kinase transmembrane receptor ROR1 [Holothuria leucospilota]|uniref:Inactive tyrosine-protein kinase transmembrane receptor ROR1 n=1 Tax=Holothuria leucospilota TaxID=206669 RepID=A0A9Q1H6K6_HOLLE|nr:Inactive tyrosine-protein kinase transmembrane receptor ROR1 [Holothuria leucospilota]
MSDFVPNFDLNFDLSSLDDDFIIQEVTEPTNGPETSGGRFQNLSEDEVTEIAKSRMEKSTVYNTSWGVRILKKWCSTKGLTQEFEKLPVSDLSNLLRQFYAEVRKEDGSMYSKQSYVGLRAAIHRHIAGEPYKRQINIMQDREFQATNHVFLGVLKALKPQGLDFSKPKPVIGEGDLKKLFSSNTLGMHTPKALLNLVWFYIEFHFCRRGREGLTNLKKSFFRFQKDDIGRVFCALKFNESTKITQEIPGPIFNLRKECMATTAHAVQYKTSSSFTVLIIVLLWIIIIIKQEVMQCEMDFIYWHLPLASLLVLLQVVPSSEETVFCSMDRNQNSTTCVAEVNTSVCLVCPKREAAHKESSENWWYNGDPIYRNGNNVGESNTQLNCSSELYSLLVPHVVLSGMDIVYFCGKSKTNWFAFNVRSYGTDDEPLNGNDLLVLYIAVPCLFLVSLLATFFVYFKVKNGRQQIKNTRTKERQTVTIDDSEGADISNAFVYSDITKESETTTSQVISSPPLKISLVTRLKTGGKFDYWSATYISESSEEEKCFAKTLSSYATMKDAAMFQDLAMNLQSLKHSAFVVQLMFVSVEEKFHSIVSQLYNPCFFTVPYAIYYEYMECGSLRDFMLRRYQQARSSRMSIKDTDILPANVKSQIQELLTFATMITAGMKFITSQKFSHPALSLRKVLLSEYCQCKLYDIYPTEMAMAKINDLMTKDYPPIAWLAPETIFLHEYETCSDVWSFAVLLWELFSLGNSIVNLLVFLIPNREKIELHTKRSGDTPFARDTADEVEQKIREGAVLPQTLCCPGAMYSMMLSCWNNASNKRPTFDGMLPKMETMLEKLKESEAKLPHQNEVPQPSYSILDAKEATNNYI